MQAGADAGTDSLVSDLNEAQKQAVIHFDGPLLILAGPGSGKTRVVTRRAAYLARTVTDPRHILAITFTNKAAGEMRKRLDARGLSGEMTVSTFHSLGARLLREFAERVGIPRNFTIFDTDDRRRVLRDAIERSGCRSDRFTPSAAEQRISRAKNSMIPPEAYARAEDDYVQRTFGRIYAEYERRLCELGGLDFDDLLVRTAEMLERDPEIRDGLEDRFRYVLVDEYQDTNAAQYKIARLLTGRNRQLCATGDPDQSIYGWRGADIGNILSFERDFPSAKVILLEQNYRSTRRILAAADALIAANARRKNKSLRTDNDDGVSVRVVECEDGDAEARILAESIAEKIASGVAASGIAVFYRVNSLSRAVEEALRQRSVRYQIARGVEFYSRREIKDTLAYLRVLVNPADELSLLRIINVPPRGIGGVTVEKLKEQAADRGVALSRLLVDGQAKCFSGKTAGRVREFGDFMRDLAGVLELPASQAVDAVLRLTGLRAHHQGESWVEDDPSANLDELLSAAAAFERDHPAAGILEWLEHAALISDVDSFDGEKGGVTLMTLHSAKGLEFDHVFVLGLEDGLLPMMRRDEDGLAPDEGDVEEERRLLFVGMTRARRGLTLSRARYRMHRGVTRRTIRSRFLDELPQGALEWTSIQPDGASELFEPGRRRSADAFRGWDAGTLVRHPLHGIGRLEAVFPAHRGTHVNVAFRDGAKRTMILEFADLERVDFDDVGDD